MCGSGSTGSLYFSRIFDPVGQQDVFDDHGVHPGSVVANIVGVVQDPHVALAGTVTSGLAPAGAPGVLDKPGAEVAVDAHFGIVPTDDGNGVVDVGELLGVLVENTAGVGLEVGVASTAVATGPCAHRAALI